MITCSNNSICYESLEDSFAENPLFVGILFFLNEPNVLWGGTSMCMCVCALVSVGVCERERGRECIAVLQ